MPIATTSTARSACPAWGPNADWPRERVPKPTVFYSQAAELSIAPTASGGQETPVRVLSTPNTPMPEVQLLSNGRYHVMITNAGGGYSRWKDMAVTRWREDTTRDNWGPFC